MVRMQICALILILLSTGPLIAKEPSKPSQSPASGRSVAPSPKTTAQIVAELEDENAQRHAAALQQVVTSKHLAKLKTIVLKSPFDKLPEAVAQQVEEIKADIKGTIVKVALKIETHGRSDISIGSNGELIIEKQSVDDESMSEEQRKIYLGLSAAQVEHNVSVRAIIETLRLFQRVNGSIVERAAQAARENNKQLEWQLYVEQAIYVEALGELVLQALNSMGTDGRDSLKRLKESEEKAIHGHLEESRQVIKDAQERARTDKTKARDAAQTESTEESTIKLLERGLVLWGSVGELLERHQNWQQEMKSKTGDIRDRIGAAHRRLVALQRVKVVEKAMKMIEGFTELDGEYHKLPLITLTNEMVDGLVFQSKGGKIEQRPQGDIPTPATSASPEP